MKTKPARLIIGLAWLVLLVSGCATGIEPGSAPMTRYTLSHGELEREYFVVLPSAFSDRRSYPLVLFMHGYGGSATGTEAEVANGLARYADEYGYVMVLPQSSWFLYVQASGERQVVTSWNHISDGFDKGPEGPICTADAVTYPCPPECGTCGQCGWASCNDDVGFLRGLVARLTSDFPVDPGSVYVSGFGNGAMMANRIACEASELFAAAALVGGRVEPGFECTPEKAMPLLQVNGGRDEAVPYDGRVSDSGYLYASTKSVALNWNDGAACAAKSADWTSPVLRGENVSCTVACADSDRESIDCLWAEGNHRWPGAAEVPGRIGHCVTELQAASMPQQPACAAVDLSRDAWGSRLMFEFFDRHSRQ